MVDAFGSARDRLGQRLGKYELEDVLGVGGTAVVYRAKRDDGTHVALKMLHDYLAKSTDVRRRFMREGYLGNMLNHPLTVRVLDDGETEDDNAYLVLELLEGETLEERRVRCGGTLPLADVLDWMDQLLSVLEVAHAQHVVHRDIKPSNLFVLRDCSLKVLDFGIARIVDEVGAATVTKSGQTMGTPAFMPPEQALSKPREIDAQSDLWSVGATMFMLLSGDLVHVAESSSEHLVKAATLHARSIAKVLPGVPDRVEALVAKALSFHKKDRWTSATEMRAELAKVRLSPGRPIGTPSRPPPKRNPLSDAPTVPGRMSDRPALDSDKPSTRDMSAVLNASGPPSLDWRTHPFALLAASGALAIVLAGVTLMVHGAITGGADRSAGAATTHIAAPPPAAPVHELATTTASSTNAATGPAGTPATAATAAAATATPAATTAPGTRTKAPAGSTAPGMTAAAAQAPAPPRTPGKPAPAGGKVDIYRPF